MTILTRDIWPDVTLPLLADPYRYISRRAHRSGSDAFASRLLGRPALFLTGPSAAAFFYAPGRFHRQKAVPELVAHVLYGEGGVQRLDGVAHRWRKALWLDLMAGDQAGPLAREVERAWTEAAPELAALATLDLFLQTARVLTTAVCRWAGAPLEASRVAAASEMLSSLFLHAAALGPQHFRGRRNRNRAGLWARDLVGVARAARKGARDDPLSRIAQWQDGDGRRLSEEVAATEVLNLLRPVISVAVYVTYLAMALHTHPAHRERVAAERDFRNAFVQEVRRFYPFFPAVSARTVGHLTWRGDEIPPDTRTVLDLYGTCRSPSAWPEPDRFWPERFLDWSGDPWALIPQGGGEPDLTHRCPGEWFTFRIMSLFARRLARSRYEVATPDACPNFRAAPALPQGGFLLTGYRSG